jgi:hypothetical protein
MNGKDNHTSYPTTINYNGWMDADNYQLRYQLMFEAERELLKEFKTDNKLTFYKMFDETVAGVEEGYKVRLSLHMETPPALSVSTKDGDFVGMFYLRDPEFQSSPTTAKRDE